MGDVIRLDVEETEIERLLERESPLSGYPQTDLSTVVAEAARERMKRPSL